MWIRVGGGGGQPMWINIFFTFCFNRNIVIGHNKIKNGIKLVQDNTMLKKIVSLWLYFVIQTRSRHWTSLNLPDKYFPFAKLSFVHNVSSHGVFVWEKPGRQWVDSATWKRSGVAAPPSAYLHQYCLGRRLKRTWCEQLPREAWFTPWSLHNA